MIDWSAVLSVAVSGIISVFLALGLLQVALIISGAIIKRLEDKGKNQFVKSN